MIQHRAVLPRVRVTLMEARAILLCFNPNQRGHDCIDIETDPERKDDPEAQGMLDHIIVSSGRANRTYEMAGSGVLDIESLPCPIFWKKSI
jgi:hypothetical protein